MFPRWILGLILLPAAALGTDATFTLTISDANGVAGGKTFAHQPIVITGRASTLLNKTLPSREVETSISGASIQVGNSTFHIIKHTHLIYDLDSGKWTIGFGKYYSSVILTSLLTTAATSAGSSYNLTTSFSQTVTGGTGNASAYNIALTSDGNFVQITSIASDASVTVTFTVDPNPESFSLPPDSVYRGNYRPKGKHDLLAPDKITSTDLHGIATQSFNLPSAVSTYVIPTITPTGTNALLGTNAVANYDGLQFLTTTIPGFNPNLSMQAPFQFIASNNTTVSGNPVSQLQSFQISPTGVPMQPIILYNAPPIDLNSQYVWPDPGYGQIALPINGALQFFPITTPGGPLTTITTSYAGITGLGATPFGLAATVQNQAPLFDSAIGLLNHHQFTKFSGTVFGPLNPVYGGCGNIVYNQSGGHIESYNPRTRTNTQLYDFSTIGGVFQIFSAGPYLTAILTNGTAQLLDLNLPFPCFDKYNAAVTGALGVRARAGSPDAAISPSGAIVMGPDGAMWFANPAANAIGRVTGGGTVDSFPTLSSAGGPQGIAIGSDGNYWITETAANKIQRMTAAQGISTEFGGLSTASAPANIIAGPDGALWFNESGTGKIGRITTAGVVTEFAASGANSIAAGPDGAVWYTETGAAKIGRITTAGAISECALANVATQIAAGPDGNMWFTEAAANKIGQITTDGACTVTEFSAGLTASAGLDAITLGSDGSLWFTEDSARQLGRIDTFALAIAEYPLPSGLASTAFGGIATGVEGGVWIAGNAGEIVRNMLPAGVVSSEITVGTNPPGQTFTFDGASLTSALTFSVPLGTDHTLGATLPAPANGTRVSFTGWSDGTTTASDAITGGPVPSMYIANFVTQYQLTTASSPSAGGSVTASPSSADGFYNAGTTVQLTPVPNAGYRFTGWSGDVTNSATPATVTMSAAHTVTANFAALASGTASPVSASPASGNTATQTFTFTFSDTAGAANLQVVDILINNFLDGRHACYIAFVPATSSLLLVDDAGDANGPYSGTVLPGNGTDQNSQCSIAGAASSFTANGNTLTLTLAITFSASFAGNKVIYMSAQDVASGTSGWSALGTCNVPGAAPAGPSVSGMSPGRTSSGGPTAYTFTFTDTNGFADITVADILINNFIDGRHACYVAFVPATSQVLLVDDSGDAGGPYSGMVLPGTGTVSNSQCTITGAGSSVTGSGNTLTLVLSIAFNHSFTGNRVFYLAARNNTQNSDWQAAGSVGVP